MLQLLLVTVHMGLQSPGHVYLLRMRSSHAKTLDSVEFPVMLDKLFSISVIKREDLETHQELV